MDECGIYLTGIEERRCRIAVVLGRRREARTLEEGRIAYVLRFGHVDEEVHARAVLVRVVVARSRLVGRSSPVVTRPVQIVLQHVAPPAPALFEIATGPLQHFICFFLNYINKKKNLVKINLKKFKLFS